MTSSSTAQAGLAAAEAEAHSETAQRDTVEGGATDHQHTAASAEAGSADVAAAAQAQQQRQDSGAAGLAEDNEDDDEDEETCYFCKFMKGGGCAAVFKAWEACVDSHRDDVQGFATQCADATLALQECMEKPENRDYYAPMLEEEAEYVREQSAKHEAEARAAAESAAAASGAKSSIEEAEAKAAQ